MAGNAAVAGATMRLSGEERDILRGDRGPVPRKVLESIVRYGEAFGATHLEPITAPGHCVMSAGASMITSYYEMIDELVNAGMKTVMPFTVDPRPYDPEMPRYSLFRRKKSIIGASLLNSFVARRLEKRLFRFLYRKQESYERSLMKLGLRDSSAFSCACYLPQTGNTPSRGDILAWAESSAVVYANSVIGARTNRNSGGIDMLCNIMGRAPAFGLLTDEGRKAAWMVEVKTASLPPAQVLGSAIGMKVMEDTPYITGLDRFLNSMSREDVRDYLKDMGAAAASNGAVGLYHIENVTPEALDSGRALLTGNCTSASIGDADIEDVIRSYPVMWRKPGKKPEQCLIGCPHLSLEQLDRWASDIHSMLEKKGRKRLKVETILSAPPAVLMEFNGDERSASRLKNAGAQLTAQCPLMYMNNPLSGSRRVITPSNKLRTYTKARYYRDDEILDIITG